MLLNENTSDQRDLTTELFSLRVLCDQLIGELNESVGDKNIVKLSLDIQLPDKLIGPAVSFKQTIKDIVLFVSRDLINGAIGIEISKRSEHAKTVTAHVQITGTGIFRGKDGIHNTEEDKWLKNLPYPVHHKTSEREVNFEFNAELSMSEAKEKIEKKPFDKKKVLIVEDNEINAMVFSSFLEEWGCETFFAVNGAEAVSQAHETAFDIILMDIYMPVMNGHLATIKIREFNPSVPIFALTASTEEKDIQEAKKTGVNDYLVKPVSSTQLFNALSKYL